MFGRFYCLAGIFLSLVFSGSAYAQNASGSNRRPDGPEPKGTYIQLTLADSLTKAPLDFVTVSLCVQGQQTPFKYTSSDAQGNVILSGIKEGKYILKMEYVGYKTKTRSVQVEKGANKLGNILMQEDISVLDAVVVTDVANPMTIKKDTIEFNSAAFKVNDTDALEELLKKLPGVEVDADGKITANGKEINKIMINGKEFGLDDPQLATKNLPAKIVEKVRVVEKKSDQAMFTGIDDGEEETVIDLGIKKGMMNGWMGDFMGGYGSKDRYQAAGMAANFTEQNQIAILGGGNNTNNRSAGEVAGMRGGGGFGFGGRGITTSWMGAVNANTDLMDGKLKLQGYYGYRGSDRDIQEKRARQTLRDEGDDLFYNEEGWDKSVDNSHDIRADVDYSISEKTSILFRPSFRFGYGNYESYNSFTTLTGMDKTNEGISKSYGDNDSKSARGMLLFRQRLGKPGRTISLRVDYGYSSSGTDGFNFSETDYYKENIVDSSAVIDQHFNQEESSYNVGGRLSYTEPLGHNFYMETAYRYNYRHTDSDKKTYNADKNGDYTELDDTYSNYYQNVFITQQAELTLSKQEEKYSLNVGASLQPSYTKSIGSQRDYKNSVANISPSARFDYRFSDSKFLRVNYRGRTNQPSINQLQPIADNSNPLKVTVGNPDLKPEFSQSLSLEYRTNNRETFSWFGTWLNASYTSDKIISYSRYREDGVQEVSYKNESGIYSINGRMMYNGRIAQSNFSINNFTYASFNNGISYSNLHPDSDASKVVTKTLNVSENLRITYRNDYMEIAAGGRANYQNAWYNVEERSKKATWTNAVTGMVNVNIPGGFNITSDIAYTYYIGFDQGYGENSTLWNAEVSKNLLKNAATLKFKIYDILKQERNTSRTTADDYIQDVQNNTLGQYIMVSFTYRFGKFGGQQMGPMGPMGGPGRGPMRGPRR